jgi:hypothetical protein
MAKRLPRLRCLQPHAGLVAVRELDAGRFECGLNSKTLFACRCAKSVLNLAEQADAETCSRTKPRGLDLSAGDHPVILNAPREVAAILAVWPRNVYRFPAFSLLQQPSRAAETSQRGACA